MDIAFKLRRGLRAVIAVATASLAFTACSSTPAGSEKTPEPASEQTTLASSEKPSKATDNAAAGEGIKVLATTGYLADAVKNIAPKAEITTMVGPSGDPHTYQPTTNDIDKMQSADVVFWTGVHLESQMLKQLEGLGEKQLAVGNQLPQDQLLPWPEEGPDGKPLHDPHIWNDPNLWMQVCDLIADKMAKVDSNHADAYKANVQAYKSKISDAVAKAKELLNKVPEGKRNLVTGHDAFNYFGRTFGYKIYATDFVSSEAKKSAAEISELAKKIAELKVPTIFVDNLSNPQAITSLKEAVKAKGWEVKVSDKALYADSLGENAPADTYIGVLESNAKAISEGLSK